MYSKSNGPHFSKLYYIINTTAYLGYQSVKRNCPHNEGNYFILWVSLFQFAMNYILRLRFYWIEDKFPLMQEKYFTYYDKIILSMYTCSSLIYFFAEISNVPWQAPLTRPKWIAKCNWWTRVDSLLVHQQIKYTLICRHISNLFRFSLKKDFTDICQ